MVGENIKSGTEVKETQLKITTPTQIDSHIESDNFENINESDLPCIGDTSSSTVTQPQTVTQEEEPIPKENLPPGEAKTVSETNITESHTNEPGYQGGSTRDESQDSLLGELMIVSQPSNPEESNEEMVNPER